MPRTKLPREVVKDSLGALFEALLNPVLVMNESWSIEFVNQAAIELFGYTREEFEGLEIDDLVPEQLRERYRSLRDGASSRGVPGVLFRGERLVRAKDGREIPVEVALSRVLVDGTEFRVSSAFDLTAQKEAEQETIERLYSIVEHSEVGVFLIQVTEDGAYLFETFNPVTERLTGLTRERARGRRPEEVVPEYEAARITEQYRRAVELGTPFTYEEVGDTRVGERVFRTTLVPIRNRAGRVHRLIGLSHDITEQKSAERALAAAQLSLQESEQNSSKARREARHSEERFAKAFGAIQDALAIVELETGLILEVNQGFERLFGYARAELVQRASFATGFWVDPLQQERARSLMLERGTLRDFPIVALRADGQHRDCLLSADVVTLDEGGAVIAYIRDVTEKLRVERVNAELEAQLRQAQKMDALGTLAGGIAHDFNNILGAILAYAELIKMDVLLPQQVETYVTELKRAGERAKDLVQQILTFSRRQPQQRRPVRVDVAVRDALNLLRSTLPATIRIEASVSTDTPIVLADVTQIHQVMTNLGTNALHAMRHSPGTLRVTLDTVSVDQPTSQLEARRYARISVSDTGQGMSPETVRHMFEPFFTTKLPGEGTGLGLAVVDGIVRDHEGAISVTSEPGLGTTVTIFLPEHEAALHEEAAAKTELRRANGQRVLFIDDEAVLCRSVSSLLDRLGYRVTARTDPAEALDLFKKNPQAFDVVLTDLTMPGLTGVDVAREVQRLAPQKPVLMMSGFNSTWTAEALRAVGVVELIKKPLGAVQLSETLASALARGAR